MTRQSQPHRPEHSRHALAAATTKDANAVQQQIADSFGFTDKRPVGDRPNNHGLMGSSGSYDLKLIELVTNMQDAVIERLAIARWGDSGDVPYESPHEAAADLLPGNHLGAHPVAVTFRESNPPTGSTKRLTAVFRDLGCGLRPEQLPSTVFQLGGSFKEDLLYQQGAFGIGGAMTYRNAQAVVIVSRRAPELLGPDDDDLITVAVVEWETFTKGSSAFYLVDRQWNQPGDVALPWSCPAEHMPEFDAGTHLAVVSYGVDGLQRVREGDAKTFDTVVNTRLFRPVMPVRFSNEITGRNRSSNLRGLDTRLRDNPSAHRPEGSETLPFNSGGTTYHLPVHYWVFAKDNTPGARSSFAAAGHVVVFLSNGQVHHHWSGPEFKTKTKLKRLHDRVFITVDTDQLPIQLRTSLFTADRSSLVRNDPALRLEEAVRSFLDDWEPLQEENAKLVREGLRSDDTKSTLDIARKIGRALSVRGFALGGGAGGTGGNGPGGAGGGGKGGGAPTVIVLHTDPTRIQGPATARAEIGKTRSISFIIDVVDTFFSAGRGRLSVTAGHAGIGDQELAIGQVRNGRFRIAVAVPEGLTPGIEDLTVTLTDWFKTSGGLGEALTFTTRLELVDEMRTIGGGSGKPTGGGQGSEGPQAGGNVALIWTSHENDSQDHWNRMTVGEIITTSAKDVAAMRPEYADLIALGERQIPVVMLNEEFPPLKQYLAARSKNLTNLDRPREEYALGIGVDLLILDEERQRREQKELVFDEELAASAHVAAARAVLAVMPAFDEIAKQAGLDDD